jgi:hypothetical protein
MQIKLINSVGEIMLLPEAMAVEGYPDKTNLPSTRIEGRDGERIEAPLRTLDSRSIRVSGELKGVDAREADALRDMIAGFINRNNPLKLYRDATDEKYIEVWKEGFDHSYHVGHFKGSLFRASLTFRAADPYFYGPEEVIDTYVNLKSGRIEAENPNAHPELGEVKFVGKDWSKEALSGYSNGSSYYTTAPLSYCEVKFNGTGISLVSAQDVIWCTSEMLIYLDDNYVTTINTKKDPTTRNLIVYTVTGLVPGSHILKVVHGKADNLNMIVDAFDIIGSPSILEDNPGTADSVPTSITWEPAERTYGYDFLGITSPSGKQLARGWFNQINLPNPSFGDEFTSPAYSPISTINSQVTNFNTEGSLTNSYSGHTFSVPLTDIANLPADIKAALTDIEVSWYGYGKGRNGDNLTGAWNYEVLLKVWNSRTSAWEDLGTAGMAFSRASTAYKDTQLKVGSEYKVPTISTSKSFRIEAEAPYKERSDVNVTYGNVSGGATGWSKNTGAVGYSGTGYMSSSGALMGEQVTIDFEGSNASVTLYDYGNVTYTLVVDGVSSALKVGASNSWKSYTLYSGSNGRHVITVRTTDTSILHVDCFDIIGNSELTADNTATAPVSPEIRLTAVEQTKYANGLGKVAGSVTENKHKVLVTASSTVDNIADFSEVTTQADLDNFRFKDGVVRAFPNTGAGNIMQVVIRVDNSDKAPSNAVLKTYARELTFKVTARGSGPSGSFIRVRAWDFTLNSGAGGWSATYEATSSSETLTDLSVTIPASDVSKFIGSSGESYLILFAEPSNGTTASRVELDYWQCSLKHCYAKLGSNVVKNRGKNLVVNPSFESDLTGWSANNAQASIDTSKVIHGSKSVKLIANGTNVYVSQNVPAYPGQILSASVYAETQDLTGGSAVFKIQWFKGALTYVSEAASAKQLSGTNGMTRYSFTNLLVPPGVDNLHIEFQINPVVTSGMLWVDAVMVEPGTSVSTFIVDDPDQTLSLSPAVELGSGDVLKIDYQNLTSATVTRAGGTTETATYSTSDSKAFNLLKGTNSILITPEAGECNVAIDDTKVLSNQQRYVPGKFGSALMVEEGTTNVIPLANQKFVGWNNYSGSTVTLTQGQVVPEWGAIDATRIQTSGGDSVMKMFYSTGTPNNGEVGTISAWVKNLGTNPVYVGITLDNMATISPGEAKRVSVTKTFDGAMVRYIRFATANASQNLDIIAWHPMIEAKSYATSFTEGERKAEVPAIPTAGILKSEEGTIEIVLKRPQWKNWIYLWSAESASNQFHCR